MTNFSPSIDGLKAAVDAELHRFLTQKRDEVPAGRPLIEEIDRLIRAGGKRLRPAFCYWGYRGARGRHDRRIVRAASALELLHTFALVHDDLMDSADERRGVPTTHAKHGIDLAVLVGDLALVLADDMFLTAFDSATSMRAFRPYSGMRQHVIAGQYLDVAARDREVDEEMARRIAVLKSGCYTVAEPLIIGATLAGAPEDMVRGLEDFGLPLGEAFQLRDDVLGLFGSGRELGKPIDSDVREGKRHVLYAKTVAALDDDERARFEELWGGGAGLTDADVDFLRAAVESSGARSSTEQLVTKLEHQALEALERLDIDPGSRAALGDLADRAVRRTA